MIQKCKRKIKNQHLLKGKLIRKEKNIQQIKDEKVLYLKLMEEQRALRLKGIDIEIIAMLNSEYSLSSRYYLGAIQTYLETGKKIWKRIGLEIPVEERTYNTILELCVKESLKVYKDHKAIIRKDLF